MGRGGHETGTSAHVSRSPPRGLLEHGSSGAPHVGALGKSNPLYVYSRCVLCKMKLERATPLQGNLFSFI